MKPPEITDDLLSGSHMEVVGISQDDVGTESP
jgi:hypothetical protein